MKKLNLKEIIILSLVEQSAIRINLDSEYVVIVGDNDRGKSCLIKSIYYGLGASPPQVHPEWLLIKPITILKFEKDEKVYNIFRNGNYIVLFNENYEIIKTFSSVGNELSPFFENYFDFRLKLKHSTSGELKTPLPSHYFLPFYIDQDEGWRKNWSSFARLGEFKDWRRDIIEYHTGIKPNEYYILKAEKATQIEKRKEILTEMDALERVYKRTIEKNNSPINVNIDVEKFQKEIDKLVKKLNEIRDIENKYKEAILSLYNEVAILEKQIKLADETRKSLNKDFEYAELQNEEVECPTCGATYCNSFTERYIIAQDENRCFELLLELTSERDKLKNQIQKEKEKLNEHIGKRTEIENILNKKKGELKLNDYIESVGQSKLIEAMNSELDSLDCNIYAISNEIKELENAMKKYVSGELKEEIENYYFRLMKSYLHQLNVFKLKDEDFESITCQIKENGSDLSRALLAYFYSVLSTMQKYSSTYMCPIIIDSPLQNEQDEINSVNILEFIRDLKPKETQLILSCVDIHEVKFDGIVVELTEKYQLLSKEKFSIIFEDVKHIIEKAMVNNAEN